MPALVLLALLGLGFVFATKKSPGPHATGLIPAGLTMRQADGILVATKDGATLAAQRLLRYGPAMAAPGSAIEPAFATKKFLGMIGAAGVPPITLAETAMDWVRDAALSGKAILLAAPLFVGDATAATLPTTIHMMAVNLVPDVPLGVQLGPYMAEGSGWVLFGDPTELASKAPTWPDSVGDFIALG